MHTGSALIMPDPEQVSERSGADMLARLVRSRWAFVGLILAIIIEVLFSIALLGALTSGWRSLALLPIVIGAIAVTIYLVNRVPDDAGSSNDDRRKECRSADVGGRAQGEPERQTERRSPVLGAHRSSFGARRAVVLCADITRQRTPEPSIGSVSGRDDAAMPERHTGAPGLTQLQVSVSTSRARTDPVRRSPRSLGPLRSSRRCSPGSDVDRRSQVP
jgi:hypothetical protein